MVLRSRTRMSKNSQRNTLIDQKNWTLS
ncbi:MAG: hypothetical protein ACI9HA_003817, partial [Dinoroseobacter sp.]